MLELLGTVMVFLLEILMMGWNALVLVLGFVSSVLLHLHVDMPRLEGLLVGVALAWVLARRDRHPLLKVLSAPLKLVIDILDLAWDQVVDVIGDVWSVASGWVLGSLKWVWGKVVGAWDWQLGLLSGLRDKLKKSE